MRQYFPILQERVRAREFNSLFLFVTSRCNSLCRTCFYFDKLNSPDDLTTAQIERISATAPPFRKLWLSGGEPFLRENLAEIVALFVERKGVRNVNLPTNGLLPEKIFRIVDRMLELCPEVAIDLNFSLDGLANTHDSIRGVPHNFVRTLATIEQAERRYGGVRRLRRNVLTVITRENYNEIVALGLHLMEQSHIDGQYFEVVRGAALDPSLKQLTQAGVAALHRRPALRAPPVPSPLCRQAFPGTCRQACGISRRCITWATCDSTSTCTSSAWNPRRNGRCLARPAKPPS
jgi:MoaA/NifB/PqqE/SkfB family radical SAM enzyme